MQSYLTAQSDRPVNDRLRPTAAVRARQSERLLCRQSRRLLFGYTSKPQTLDHKLEIFLMFECWPRALGISSD